MVEAYDRPSLNTNANAKDLQSTTLNTVKAAEYSDEFTLS